jgi:PAS domain S-box-containing protein
MRPDGEKIYVELSFAVVKDASGKVAGALAFGRDITERFTSDRELRRKLRELEKASVTTE